MHVFTSPGSIAFSFCGFSIYYYGILMGIAITISLLISHFYAKQDESEKCNIILDTAPTILLFGIIGARLYYCLLNYSYYSHNLIEILAIRNGGLSIHGAFIGGLLALYLISKTNKISFLHLSDLISLGLPLGQCIARWGNFFNSEAFGLPCNLPWKLYIPVEHRPIEYLNFNFFHPTFLYESLLDFVIFIILFIVNKNRPKSGIITILYMILYSSVRIFVESYRIDSMRNICGIPLPIIVSITIIIISVVSVLFIYKKRN